MDTPKRLNQGVMRHSSDHVALSSGGQRLMNILIAFIGGEHDKAGLLMPAANGLDRIHTAHAGQAQIHQRYVWPVLLEQLHSFFAIARLSHCDHIRAGIDDGGYTYSHQRVVIDDKHFNLFRVFHCFLHPVRHHR